MTTDVSEKINVLWSLPTSGDGRYLGTKRGGREVDLPYLKQVTQAVEALGYYGISIPAGNGLPDPWVIASALAPLTDTIRYLVGVRAELLSPIHAARMAKTFNFVSGGRFLLDVIKRNSEAKDDIENQVHVDKLLRKYRKLTGVEPNRDRMELDGGVIDHPSHTPHTLYYGESPGISTEVPVGGFEKYVLAGGETPRVAAEKIATLRSAAAKSGHAISFGIRLNVIVRETEAAAWLAAEDLIQFVDDEILAKARGTARPWENRGHGLEIGPNLWSDVSISTDSPTVTIVGDPDQVKSKIGEYRDTGIDTFILSGYPHLEEAYRFGELVLPHLLTHPRQRTSTISINGGQSLRIQKHPAPATKP